MLREKLHIDSARHTVRQGDRLTHLPYKSWRVLQILMDASPATVSRRALVDEVWAGNDVTGEKGLNQAIWAIRRALGDEARAPRFLKTVPRVGYRWVAAELETAEEAPLVQQVVIRKDRFLGVAAGILVLLIGATTGLLRYGSAASGLEPADVENARMWRDGARLIVELAQGCRAILVAEKGKRFGASALSDDGQRIVLELIRDSDCRLLEFDLLSNTRREISSCLAREAG